MKVSYHAAQRFLERVVNQLEFSKMDIHNTQDYLEGMLKDVVISSYKRQFALPNFQRFVGVYQEDVLVTIIPKDKKRLRPSNKFKKYTYIGD